MERPVVIVIDDDRSVVHALRARCEAQGAEVESFASLTLAVQRIAESVPALVLLDVNLPAGSALEQWQKLRMDTPLARIPVVVMTGDSDEETRHRAKIVGATYVRKGAHLWSRLEPLVQAAIRGYSREAA
jgi:DNA-binding response OmpR family regulator